MQDREPSPTHDVAGGGDGQVSGLGAGAGADRGRPADGRSASQAPDDVADRTDDDIDDDDGDESARPGRRRRKEKPRSLRRSILEWVGVIGGGIVIALVIETFLVQAFWIPSPSMDSTLEVGDRVLVNKLAYHLHDVSRGDIVVFTRPPEASGDGDEIKDLIKRVIAVGGDTIEGRNGLVYVNGERLDESGYLAEGATTDNLPRQTVPEGHVFVMGDNRTNSEDSRVFGYVDQDTIVGRAFLRVLPLDDIGWL